MNAQIENEDYVADFVETAVRVAQTLDGVEEQGEILTLAASVYAESAQTDLALGLAETIDDAYQRDLALTTIAATCAARGDGEQADSLLEMIEDEVAYGSAIEQIATAYAQSGAIDKAVETARRLNDSDSALSNIARACPSRDVLTDCIEIARSIDFPELKATALIELAGKARQLEARPESAELIEEAAATAEAIDFPEPRIEARVRIAAWYKENDQTEQAAEVLSKARSDCEETARSGRDAMLEQVAAAYAGLRDFKTADQLLEEIEDPFEFSNATAAVAFEHFQAGDQTAAIKLLAEGLEVIKDEPVYTERTLIRRRAVLANVAHTYAAIGHIEDALRVNELLDFEEQKDASLGDIAYTLAATDNGNAVFKVLEKIKDDSMRVLCEVNVVHAWSRSDRPELADHLLSNASAEVAKVEWPQQRTKCFAELAQAYALREQPSRCSEYLFEALKSAAMIKGSYFQARALLGLALKHKELARPPGEPERQILEEITAHLD